MAEIQIFHSAHKSSIRNPVENRSSPRYCEADKSRSRLPDIFRTGRHQGSHWDIILGKTGRRMKPSQETYCERKTAFLGGRKRRSEQKKQEQETSPVHGQFIAAAHTYIASLRRRQREHRTRTAWIRRFFDRIRICGGILQSGRNVPVSILQAGCRPSIPDMFICC